MTNEELVMNWPQRTTEDIFRLTGIESRRWIDNSQSETVVSLAVQATRQLLLRNTLTIHDVDLVIACTTTPDIITPSLACRISAAVAPKGEQPTLAAYDINAACSGYIYALAQAFDYLQQQPSARVLIVTSEVLSPMLNMGDFDTAILFGDAATATLVIGAKRDSTWLQLHRPVISGNPDRELILCVPLRDRGAITMNGGAVFRRAVRSMEHSLHHACRSSGLELNQIDLVVPHQANQRVLSALSARIQLPIAQIIRDHGNTSSSSIPLIVGSQQRGAKQRLGLVAYGGGSVFGSAILTTG